MEEYVQIHVNYVLEQFAEAKRKTPDAILLIEQKVDITHLHEPLSRISSLLLREYRLQ